MSQSNLLGHRVRFPSDPDKPDSDPDEGEVVAIDCAAMGFIFLIVVEDGDFHQRNHKVCTLLPKAEAS